MSARTPVVVLCNGASLSSAPATLQAAPSPLAFDYRTPLAPGASRVELGLPTFASSVVHIPDRALDLVEIAAYVFCTDRSLTRGSKDLLVYDAWARDIHYVVRVRDFAFWSQPAVQDALSAALTWATGDKQHGFTFEPGHTTPPTGLFDSHSLAVAAPAGTQVALFSGGIDSLTGAVDFLKRTQGGLYLVSHRSSPGVQKTQQALLRSLETEFPKRVFPFFLACRLSGERSQEETQRSRSFLFCAIAYALSAALGLDDFTIYENGVTSLNLPKREGMGRARASRTTHPRTIRLFENLLTLAHDRGFSIRTPFIWCTKAEVLKLLRTHGMQSLLDSSVSCTRTFKNTAQHSHCGGCSQCIDRRFAAVAAGLAEHDHAGLYTHDILTAPILDPDARTFVVDHLAQAKEFATAGISMFEDSYVTELADIEPELSSLPMSQRIPTIFDLCQRHGLQVMAAARSLNDPTSICRPDTLLDIISRREYLKTPVVRLAQDLANTIARGIPLTFQHAQPMNEQQLNDAIDALLNAEKPRLDREHPATPFGRAKVVPDHSDASHNLLVESKFIRAGTPPSKVTEGLAADMFKLPKAAFKLMIVYDPTRRIADDDQFRMLFEKDGNCLVRIVR